MGSAQRKIGPPSQNVSNSGSSHTLEAQEALKILSDLFEEFEDSMTGKEFALDKQYRNDSWTGKEFALKYDFEDVGKLEDNQQLYSPEEEHFGVKWRIKIHKWRSGLAIVLCTNVTGKQEAHVDFTGGILKNKKNAYSVSESHVFGEYAPVWACTSIDWEDLEKDYLDDGKLEVEIHVKVYKMIGFPREKELRSFGEDVKQFSDVILKVEDRKFYVSKLYLSSQSPYFATLFLGKFQESGKTEIELKDVNPQIFQYYLEVIHAENAIDDETVEGILKVSDMYETPLAIKKCEEFLIEKSEMELKKKLELAGKYKLEELKKMCLDQIKTIADIRAVIPEDSSEMDHGLLANLFDKLLEFD